VEDVAVSDESEPSLTVATNECPLCRERGVHLPHHLPTPEGEGCPYTPMEAGPR